MPDQDWIQNLEAITGKQLKEISVQDFDDDLETIASHFDGQSNSYTLNHQQQVVGLSLQGIDGHDLVPAAIDQLNHLSFLYLLDIRTREVLSFQEFQLK
ncbi:hypothetical protein [Acaryochloris sp. IP29b_bin.137]|uniref:hypothetical protein n=1 Tax=Acaryochloris sp. IP29b_bin.137 TaxID=2969217 RepID=UPI002612F1C5|nr:hypothetical protein [Acaryochloris sp. IP29b_bin.137]